MQSEMESISVREGLGQLQDTCVRAWARRWNRWDAHGALDLFCSSWSTDPTFHCCQEKVCCEQRICKSLSRMWACSNIPDFGRPRPFSLLTSICRTWFFKCHGLFNPEADFESCCWPATRQVKDFVGWHILKSLLSRLVFDPKCIFLFPTGGARWSSVVF